MNAIIQNYKDFPAIYLYGNGGFGKQFSQKLVDIGFNNLKGFLDTYKSANVEGILPTYQIDEYFEQINSPEDIIVISSNFYGEIISEIRKRNDDVAVFSASEFVKNYIVNNVGKDIQILSNGSLGKYFISELVNYFVSDVIGNTHDSVFWGDRLITLDKSNGFLFDEKISAAFKAVLGSHVYDQYGGSHTISHRLNTLVWAARNALCLDGDFVECGVFKGDMSLVVLTATDFLSSEKTFYLYDSFVGFSDAHSSPADFPKNPSFFYQARKAYQDDLYERVKSRFSEWSSVRLIRGFLPESLEIEIPSKISYLHIDLNSPTAEVAVLDVLFDRVVPGGYIIFDDYGWELFHRQKEAEDEFMQKRGYHILELPTGQGLVIKR